MKMKWSTILLTTSAMVFLLAVAAMTIGVSISQNEGGTNEMRTVLVLIGIGLIATAVTFGMSGYYLIEYEDGGKRGIYLDRVMFKVVNNICVYITSEDVNIFDTTDNVILYINTASFRGSYFFYDHGKIIFIDSKSKRILIGGFTLEENTEKSPSDYEIQIMT